MISPLYTPIEQRRLSRLAGEYRRNGFDVHVHPSDAILPAPLQGFVVGLLARKEGNLVIADVRTRNRLALDGNRDLRTIAERIEKIPNAEYELVVTSSRHLPK